MKIKFIGGILKEYKEVEKEEIGNLNEFNEEFTGNSLSTD